jgi:hypothetical protein
MTITVEQMRRHIEALVAQYDIVCNEWARRPVNAWAVYEFEEINIAPIRSACSYATALHEIGHIKGRHQRSKQSSIRERWAWQWARENALVWSETMERYSRAALLAAK